MRENLAKQAFDDKLRTLLKEIPEINSQCLQLLLVILRRVAEAQKKSLEQKAMDLPNLGRIFASIIFSEVRNESPGETVADATKKIEEAAKLTSYLLENKPVLFFS